MTPALLGEEDAVAAVASEPGSGTMVLTLIAAVLAALYGSVPLAIIILLVGYVVSRVIARRSNREPQPQQLPLRIAPTTQTISKLRAWVCTTLIGTTLIGTTLIGSALIGSALSGIALVRSALVRSALIRIGRWKVFITKVSSMANPQQHKYACADFR